MTDYIFDTITILILYAIGASQGLDPAHALMYATTTHICVEICKLRTKLGNK